MSDIILHNYPQSPVAEKVRVALGIKGLSWRSVEIPRIPPKPMLIKLTGGYRRTPVMQIGADIYCDSQCIMRELERRHPNPTYFPGGSDGMAWGVSRWTDGALFDQVIKLVLGEITGNHFFMMASGPIKHRQVSGEQFGKSGFAIAIGS